MSFPRYPAYKDSGVEWLGEVPSQWGKARLAYACELVVDGTHHSPESRSEGEYRYVTAKNIKETGFDFSDITFVTAEAHREIYSRCPVCQGDVLYIKDGATAGIAMVNDLWEEFSLLSSVALLRPRHGELQAKYLAYHLNAPLFKSRVLASLLGGAMTRLTVDGISRFTLVLPPLPEQTAIATFLDRETAKIDALVADYRTLIELLQEKRQAVISHAVTKGLDPTVPMKDSGVEWLGEVPERWSVCALGRVTEEIQTGPFGSQLHSSDYVQDEIPVINPSNIKRGRIVPDFDCTISAEMAASLDQHRLSIGDIVFARRGEMGRCAAVTSAEAGWMTGTGSIRLRFHPLRNPSFWSYYLGTPFIRDWLSLKSVGATIDNLNASIVAQVPVASPPFDEESAIATFLDHETAAIDSLINDAEEAITLLQERRTALISAAVTGKIDVRGLVETEAA